MKPDDLEWTKEAILARLLAPRPKPTPKPAVVRAEERWSKPKPAKAVLRDHDAADKAVIEMLERQGRNEEMHRARYQSLIDQVWQSNLDYQAGLRQFGGPSFHRGPGDPDWR